MTTREIFSKAQLVRWEWIRRLGFRRYVLYFGVIAYGVPMFVVMTFFVNRAQDSPQKVFLIPFSAAFWLTAGWFFGWMGWKIWRRLEKKYHESTANPNLPHE